MERVELEAAGRTVELWRRVGEGPPIVLVHGAGANGEVWTDLGARLSGFDVAAPSLPGRGASEGAAFEVASDAAKWLDGVLGALGGPPAIVLGHSYGGAVAIELALSSARVAGLVLVSTGARLRVHPSILQAAAQAMKTSVPFSARFAFRAAADPAALDRYEASIAKTPASAVLADWRACDGFDRLGQLDELRVPCLVVGGVDDVLTPPKYPRYLAEHLPRAQLELVPEAGHMLPWERPDALARHVQAWSAGV